MLSTSNTTFDCKGCGPYRGGWASFEDKRHCKGSRFKVFRGQINGRGHRWREPVMVKLYRREMGTQRLCLLELEKLQMAQNLTKRYNKLPHAKNAQVNFAHLYCAEMDEVSALRYLYPGRRKISKKDWVLVEEDVRYSDSCPGEKRRLKQFVDRRGKALIDSPKDLETFVHFTCLISCGQLVVCNLEGAYDDKGFYLKAPVIHSRDQHFGQSDKGLPGIEEVMKNHQCNPMCQAMIQSLGDFRLPANNSENVNSTPEATLENTCSPNRSFTDQLNNRVTIPSAPPAEEDEVKVRASAKDCNNNFSASRQTSQGDDVNGNTSHSLATGMSHSGSHNSGEGCSRSSTESDHNQDSDSHSYTPLDSLAAMFGGLPIFRQDSDEAAWGHTPPFLENQQSIFGNSWGGKKQFWRY